MKIILVITNNNGKSILFVLDDFRSMVLEEAIDYVKKGKIDNAHIVKTKKGDYIRSNPNQTVRDNLDSISISIKALTKTPNKEETSILRTHYRRKDFFLKGKEDLGEKIFYIDGKRSKTEEEIIRYLSRYKSMILSVAKDKNVDPFLLAGIIIDEYLRKNWEDALFDQLAGLGYDSSVGIAQVKVSTAKLLIKGGFYNPAPKDKRFLPKNISRLPNRHLYKYLNDPKHSVYFAAAKINQVKKDFSSRYDIKKLEILASLYSRRDLEKTKGKANSRGKQIATEFYQIAKKVLKP